MQRRAAASAFCPLMRSPPLGRDLLEFDDRAVAYPCREQVNTSSAAHVVDVGSFVVSQRKVGVLVLRRGHVSTRPIVVFVLMTSFQRDRCNSFPARDPRAGSVLCPPVRHLFGGQMSRFCFDSKKVHDHLNPLRSRNCSVNLLVWHEFKRGCRRANLASFFFFFGGGKSEKGLKVAGLLGLFYLRRVRGSCRERRPLHLQCHMWRHVYQDVHPEMHWRAANLRCVRGRGKVMEHAAKPKGSCCICGANAGATAIVGHVLCGGQRRCPRCRPGCGSCGW